MRTVLLIIASWITICCIVCGSVSAERIEIHQGDVVYMNETVDISLAVSWPDYTVAWCKGENYECVPPDQVVAITGNMHKYYIDPTVFQYGTYYRWDGAWHRGENAVAFTIVNGNRSDKRMLHSDDELEAPNRIPQTEGPFQYYIARGDNPVISTRLNRTDACYLWAFTNNADTLGKQMMFSTSEGYTTYQYTFSEPDTMNMSIGTYPAYITCTGQNRILDVYADDTTITTPYKATVNATIELWNPYNIRDKYDMVKQSIPSQMYDDDVYDVEIAVSEPYTTITGIERNDDDTKLFISGLTSWENQTELIFKLDPENYKLAQDIRLHTWTTTATGPIDAPRKFVTALSIEKEDLAVGMHEIIATAKKNEDVGFSAYSFRISDIMVMPTPTPHVERKILASNWSDMEVRNETVSITPEITRNYQNATVTLTPATNLSVTADATPVPTTMTVNITTNVTTPIVPKSTYAATVPIPLWISILAVAAAVMVRR